MQCKLLFADWKHQNACMHYPFICIYFLFTEWRRPYSISPSCCCVCLTGFNQSIFTSNCWWKSTHFNRFRSDWSLQFLLTINGESILLHVASYLRRVILNLVLNFLHHKLTDGTLRRVTYLHQSLSKQKHMHQVNILHFYTISQLKLNLNAI